MTTLLQIQNLSKSFLSNRVLRSINFDVRKGEVHALIGENGAGKSTLVNIIAGIHKRDEGTMVFNGTDISFNHPLEAMKAGISLMHQELSLVPNATVAENIYLRREKRNRLGFNDWAEMNREAAAIFERIGIDIDPKALVGTLSVGMQQIVELAKAISLDAKLIIMDEPTSSLSEKETVEFFKVMRDLKARGISLIFISHKLSELFEISDRITVLLTGNISRRMTSAPSPQTTSFAKWSAVTLAIFIPSVHPTSETWSSRAAASHALVQSGQQALTSVAAKSSALPGWSELVEQKLCGR